MTADVPNFVADLIKISPAAEAFLSSCLNLF